MKIKHPKKILLVDDEISLLEVLSDYIKAMDYNVITADNGYDGLTLFMSEKPDIVLVDIRMPDMDGLDLTAEILKKSPDTAIIVISGTGCVSDVINALKLGAWDYIEKPIKDMAILEHSLAKAIERVDLKKEKKAFENLLKDQVRLRTDELEKINKRLMKEIDEHKKTETILKANENHYHSIFENAPVGIFQTTPEGQFIDTNPALANMLGYDTPRSLIDTVKASTIANVLYEHPDVRSEILKNVNEKRDWIKVEIKFRHKKGHFIPINLIIKEDWNNINKSKYLMGFVEERFS